MFDNLSKWYDGLNEHSQAGLLIAGFFAVGTPFVESTSAMWNMLALVGLLLIAVSYNEYKVNGLDQILSSPKSSDIHDDYSIADLQSLSPQKFESVVQDAWEAKGFQTELTPQGPDEGVDIFANKGDESVAIQAKKYAAKNKVRAPTVRKSVGAADQASADRVIVITSSEFTSPAHKAANQMSTDVELVNGEMLSRDLSS